MDIEDVKEQVLLFKLELLKREENQTTADYLYSILEKASIFIIITIVVYGGIYKLMTYKQYGIDYISHQQVEIYPVINAYMDLLKANYFSMFIISLCTLLILIASPFAITLASIYVRRYIRKLKIFSLLGLYTAISGAFIGTFYNKSEGVLEYLKFMAYQFVGK